MSTRPLTPTQYCKNLAAHGECGATFSASQGEKLQYKGKEYTRLEFYQLYPIRGGKVQVFDSSFDENPNKKLIL